MQKTSRNATPPASRLDRIRAIVSWAAAYQLAVGLLLGFSALFLVAPSEQTRGYPIFFVAIFVPGALMSGGTLLLGTRPWLGSAVLTAAALFDVIVFERLPFDWNMGGFLCASIQGVGALVLVALAVWGARLCTR
jgi:hypothetical protein